jgi:predicted alpha/beta hydrolase
MQKIEHTLTKEGRTIGCTVWKTKNAHITVLISPAMGITRKFYTPFAEYLCSCGYQVIAFDYYGMFASKDGPKVSRLTDWGHKDLSTVISFAQNLSPEHRIMLVGHSIAGQIFPLAINHKVVQAACFVASQSASYQFWEGKEKRLVQLFWKVVVPACLFLFRKLPGWAYGGKRALHPGIARDWQHWGSSNTQKAPWILEARKACNTVTTSTMFISISDDLLFAPPKAVEALYQHYGPPQKNYYALQAGENGYTTIGHFDFFKKSHAPLWTTISDWFAQNIAENLK